MDSIVEPLIQAYASFPLLFWILGSTLIYALGINLLWLFRSRRFWRSPIGRWPVQVGRFLFFLGIPYLALGGWPRQPYQGILSLDNMGMVGLSARWSVDRWLESMGTGLGVGLLALAALALAWVWARRGLDRPRLRFPPRPWWMLLMDVIYLEVHWAFYRGALAVLTGDVYSGVFLGLGLVCLEWSSSPYWRRGWQQESRAAGQWLRAALALVVALIFLLTRSLWVCLGIHLLLESPFWRLGRGRVRNTERLSTAGQ
jgi:hypothetical protein